MRLRTLMGSALSALTARAIAGVVGIDGAAVATGNSQATAYALKADLTIFATTAAGTGALLDGTSDIGDEMDVFNTGVSNLLVYPPVGSTINALGANATLAVVPGSWIKFKRMSVTQWASN